MSDELRLSESEVESDAIRQFDIWFREAEEVVPELPNAMTLSTSSPDGRPSARMVLLKGFDSDGFVFYTNYDSPKSEDLENNPQAALVFFWPQLGRQVRIYGKVGRVTRKESEDYFHTRPIDSQIGAWASNQSHVLSSREELETSFRLALERFGGGVIPLPPNWGGYRLAPETIEFWQSRTARLHDRLRYTRNGDNWIIDRLAP